MVRLPAQRAIPTRCERGLPGPFSPRGFAESEEAEVEAEVEAEATAKERSQWHRLALPPFRAAPARLPMAIRKACFTFTDAASGNHVIGRHASLCHPSPFSPSAAAAFTPWLRKEYQGREITVNVARPRDGRDMSRDTFRGGGGGGGSGGGRAYRDDDRYGGDEYRYGGGGYERGGYGRGGYERRDERGYERRDERGYESRGGYERRDERGYERRDERGFGRRDDRGYPREAYDHGPPCVLAPRLMTAGLSIDSDGPLDGPLDGLLMAS